MKKTLLTLVAGAAIGSGTTLTLPDGAEATTAAPTSADIYTSSEVQSLKLVNGSDGVIARYVVVKTSTIDGVAPYVDVGHRDGQQAVFNAVSAQAEAQCSEDPDCDWTSMNSARDAYGVISVSIGGGGKITVSADVPELDALKQEILGSLP